MNTHARPSPLAVALAVLAACSGPDTGRTGTVVRDSAGIRIVENTTPVWSAEDAWFVDTEPMAEVGGGDTDETQLYQINGALRLADGRTVVANSGSHELRFYDADGVFVSAAGGEGGGPGEFQHVQLLGRYRGDSIAAYDGGQRRVSVFDDTGRFGRVVNLTQGQDEGFVTVIDVFADGRFLLRTHGDDADAPQNGTRRLANGVMRSTHDLESGDSLGVFPGTESHFEQFDLAGGRRGQISLNRLFARTTRFVAHGHHLFVGTNDSYEIRIIDTTGTVEFIVRKHHPPVPIESEDVEQFIAGWAESMVDDDFRTRLVNIYRGMPVPESFPAYSRIMVDADENLWVRVYTRPGDESESWSVFTADGSLLGMVSLPERFAPTDVGTDYVLGKWTDEYDVEYLRTYRLVKPSASHDPA